MSQALSFALKLIDLHLHENWSQSKINIVDHKQAYTGKKIPISVTFTATWHCNLNCVHCSAEINNQKTDKLDTPRFLKLLDEMEEAGVVKIGITGGEPLMRPDMPEIIDKCHEKNFVSSMVTNSWLVAKHIETLKKVSLVMLSLDGDEIINDEIRGKGNWEKFQEAVKIAQANKINIAGLTNLNGINHSMFHKFPKIFGELNMHWYLQMFNDDFGVGEQANLPREERTPGSDFAVTQEQVNDVVQKVAKSPHLRTTKKYLKFMMGDHRPIDRCYAGIAYVVIDPDGMMYPCNNAYFDPDYPGVSILQNSFADAFQKLPLYRKTCDTCTLGCHIEPNYLFSFNPNAILNAYKATKPVT